MDARLFYAVEPVVPGPIDELSDVHLTTDIDVAPSGVMPRGSRGTVVAVHGDGEAYSVEFAEPFHALLLLEAGSVEAIQDATRERLIAHADTVHHRSGEDHRLPSE